VYETLHLDHQSLYLSFDETLITVQVISEKVRQLRTHRFPQSCPNPDFHHHATFVPSILNHPNSPVILPVAGKFF